MKVVDLAADLIQELGNPTDISVPSVAYWLRAQVGSLNAATYKSYYIDDTTLEILCVDPNDGAKTEEMGTDEAAILKQLYHIHYYDLQIRKNVLSYDTRKAIEITSDGHSVRLVSPTEIGRNLYSIRKNLTDEYSKLVAWYRIHRATPRQVHGDDDTSTATYYTGVYST